MATHAKIGGYNYRQHIAHARSANRHARRCIECIMDEKPGPAMATAYLVRIGLDLSEIEDAVSELDRIGQFARNPHLPSDEDR